MQLIGSPQEDAWLQALAGRSPEKDDTAMTNQALQLRQYFATRDQHESAAPLSAQSQARMLARLHRQGALRPAPSSRAVRPAPSMARRLAGWLGGWLPQAPGARYALAASVMVAALAAPLLVFQMPLADPGAKSIPPEIKAGQQIRAQDPARRLEQLRRALAEAGVPTQTRPAEGGYVLTAQVSVGQRQAAQAALAPWGLTVPGNGELEISIQPEARK